MQRTFRRGRQIVAHQPRQKVRQIGQPVAHLRRAVQRVLQDLAEIPRKHVRKDRRAFDHAGVAEAGFLAGEFVPVDQDDIASTLLQVQGGADADHAGTQYEDVGLEFRHPALPLNIARAAGTVPLKANYCGIVAQTGLPPRKSRLRGGQTLATWIGHSPR